MSNLPEIRSAPRSLMPAPNEWAQIKEQAALVVKTGLLPEAIRTPEQAIAISLKGWELGISMMLAFSHIHIIKGKPTISSELMLALIQKNVPGARIAYEVSDDQQCVILASRGEGMPQSRFKFSLEDAKRAQVMGKDNWAKYPAAMLRARCISAMARAVFPDALMGCSYTPEELGAVVDDEGVIVDVPVEKEPPQLRTVEIEDNSDGLGDYEITHGKYKGQTLKSIDLADLKKHVNDHWMSLKRDKREPEPWVKELIQAVKAYEAEQLEKIPF